MLLCDMQEQCTDCGCDLEVGQIGKCGDCQEDEVEKTEFKFSELSDRAKDKVRERYMEGRDFDSEHTISESRDILALIGIEIDEREYRTYGGNTRWEPNVDFNVGWGEHYLTFPGYWRAEKVDMAALLEHVGTEDGDLKKLGAKAMAIALRYPQAKSKLRTSSFNVHADEPQTDPDMDDRDESMAEAIEWLQEKIDDLLLDACSWFCGQLSAEYDWQTDSERADEYYNESAGGEDVLFDEDGEEL